MNKYMVTLLVLINTTVFLVDGVLNTVSAQVFNEQILLSDDRDLNDRFGAALSLNNNRALIGANSDDENGNSSGAAYVFEKSNSGWAQTTKLIADDGDEGDSFGIAVGLSGDTALVGAVFQQDVPKMGSIGAAYVFNSNGNGWTQSAKLSADDGTPGNRFAENISLSGDRALISATGDNGSIGAVYVFDLIDGVWEQSDKLTAPVPDGGDSYGRSISLLGDRALVGTNGDGATTGDNTGAVFVYDLIDGVWTETIKLVADDGQDGDQFGASVSLDEERILIGAVGFDNPGNKCPFVPFLGAAYIFDLVDGSWTQSAKIFDVDGCGFDSFGGSVSLSGDRAVIGADGVSGDPGISFGAAYLYDFKDGEWSITEKIKASDGASNDKFGREVSLFEDQFLVSAPPKDSNSGTTYAYVVDLIFADGFE